MRGFIGFLLVIALISGCVNIAGHAKSESLPLFDAHTHLNYENAERLFIRTPK